MDTKLSEEIQAAIDALALSQKTAALVTNTMRRQHVYFGLGYGHVEDDIAHILGKLRYMQLLAQYRELSEAEMIIVDTTEHIPSLEDGEQA